MADMALETISRDGLCNGNKHAVLSDWTVLLLLDECKIEAVKLLNSCAFHAMQLHHTCHAPFMMVWRRL